MIMDERSYGSFDTPPNVGEPICFLGAYFYSYGLSTIGTETAEFMNLGLLISIMSLATCTSSSHGVNPGGDDVVAVQ